MIFLRTGQHPSYFYSDPSYFFELLVLSFHRALTQTRCQSHLHYRGNEFNCLLYRYHMVFLLLIIHDIKV
jgi:hypothetical protein